MGIRFVVAWVLLTAGSVSGADRDWIWWEGENPVQTNFAPRTWLDAQNEGERDKLSSGAWLTQDGMRKGPELFAVYKVRVKEAGRYGLWARKFWKHGPFRWRFDRSPWTACGRDVALADSVTLRRHVCASWVHLGEVEVGEGEHRFEVRLTAAEGGKTTAGFDAFVLTRHPFHPRGKLKPGDRAGTAAPGWWAFEPPMDTLEGSVLDLRRLNEETAGQSGFIRRKKDGLVLGSGKRVRFWAVNCGADVIRMDRGSVDYLARRLAGAGVNLVRFHGPIFDRTADDPATLDRTLLDRLHYFIAALKSQGIYVKLSFYFPLWFTIRPEYGLDGYEKTRGKKPFALLFFEARMQEIHRAWTRGLLTTRNPCTGLPLAEDPAVAMIEIVNEDSCFFWTFRPEDMPPACRRKLEAAFGKWLARKYGSVRKGVDAWGFMGSVRGDEPSRGRVRLFGAWHMTGDGLDRTRKHRRICDQVRFLAEHQRAFYASVVRYIREDLGSKSLVCCSNWKTADPHLLDGLERWTYTAGDVLDQHGYFGGQHEGPAASYQVNVGDAFRDRAGVLEPGALPIRCNQVAGHPHIISEVGWPNPNRFKAEFPVLSAAYASLQGVDGLCFFAIHGAFWEADAVKFSLAVPTILGQFPATALMYRRGDVREAGEVLHETIRLEDLFKLKGSGALREQSLDGLRKADLPRGGVSREKRVDALDPLAFYVGRVLRSYDGQGHKALARDLGEHIDRKKKTIRSLTGELVWDYGTGLVTINTPRSQGAVGFLARAGRIRLENIILESGNEYAGVLVTSLDDRPIATSGKVLIQAVTEDRSFGWETKAGKITALGGYPVNVRNIEVTVTFGKIGALRRVTTLDAGGRPRGKPRRLPETGTIRLAVDALYSIVEE